MFAIEACHKGLAWIYRVGSLDMEAEVRQLEFDGFRLEYELIRKRVRRVNLGIRRDGSVYVSAGSRVPIRTIEEFVKSNIWFIMDAKQRIENRPPEKRLESGRLSPEEKFLCERYLRKIVDMYYPYFERRGVAYPSIQVRKLKSRWGSCTPARHSIRLNSQLLDVPKAAAEHVVVHELCHFLEANHSPAFWAEVERVLPDYCERKALLKR